MIFVQIENKKNFTSNFDVDTSFFSNMNKNHANKAKRRRKKFKKLVIRKCVKIKINIQSENQIWNESQVVFDTNKLIVKSSFKLEWVNLIRLASRKSRFEFELESNSNSWHVKRFEFESNLKSKRQNLTWIWFKFQVSMSNLIWFVKNFNFMTYYIISRYF